jgi:hypothetical protein
MKQLRLKRLNQQGFDHVLIILIFVVGFALVGTLLLIAGHAQAWSGELQLGSDRKLCMDNLSSRSTSGNTIDAYTCNSATSQKWTINEVSGYTDRFTLKDGQGTCADDWGDGVGTGPTNRVDVKTYPCNSNDHAQLWEWEHSQLENVYTHGCINDPANSTAPGTPLIVYSCVGKPSPSNELWYEETQPSTGAAGNSNPNECATEGGNAGGSGCYFWGQGIQSGLSAMGAQVTISGAATKVSSGDYHADSEIQVGNSAGDGAGGYDVEVGSIVGAGSSTPHLLIDYWKNGNVYDNDFVAVSGAPIKNGAAMPTTGTFNIAIKYVGTQWQVYYNGKEVGYYPESTYGNTVFTKVQYVDVYGEVEGYSNKETTSQMGNGLLGTNPNSAYFSNYNLFGSSKAPDLTVAGPSGAAAKVYKVGYITPTGFHYGGPGF